MVLLAVLALNFLRHIWKTTQLQSVYLGVLGLALAYAAYVSFSSQAALQAFAKYQVPVLALFHGYFYRDRLRQQDRTRNHESLSEYVDLYQKNRYREQQRHRSRSGSVESSSENRLNHR